MTGLLPEQKDRRRAARERAAKVRRHWPSARSFDFSGKLAQAEADGDHLALGYASFADYIENEIIGEAPAEFRAGIRRLLAPPPQRARTTARGVYFIQAAHGGPIKIGVAGHVPSRFTSIQYMSPCRLVLLGVLAGAGRDRERELHERFAGIRSHGEWFR